MYSKASTPFTTFNENIWIEWEQKKKKFFIINIHMQDILPLKDSAL